MIIDGKAIAADVLRGVKERVGQLGRQPQLVALTCAPTFATEHFLRIKRQRAREVGVAVDVVDLPAESTTDDAVAVLAESEKRADGVVVQLPFPASIDVATVLAHVPANRDVDVIGTAATASFKKGESPILPPVVGAIAEVADRHGISFTGKNVVVVGQGRLVGEPAAVWATQQGGTVTVFDKRTTAMDEALRQADIIIAGAGSPGCITASMIKDNAVIFDAGTSEAGGKLAGDADASVAGVASLVTPVPGGIGPITVAKLLENLLVLAESRGM